MMTPCRATDMSEVSSLNDQILDRNSFTWVGALGRKCYEVAKTPDNTTAVEHLQYSTVQ